MTGHVFDIFSFLYRIAKGALGLVLTMYMARVIWMVFRK